MNEQNRLAALSDNELYGEPPSPMVFAELRRRNKKSDDLAADVAGKVNQLQTMYNHGVLASGEYMVRLAEITTDMLDRM